MAYIKTTWVNKKAPAISSSKLNKIENGLFDQDTRLTTAEGKIANGWNSANETWTYSSVDDPTGVIKVNADVTTKYSLGMRIKMTNGGNTIFGILTKIGAYGGDETGYTYLTFLHEIDPTDSLALYLMSNSAITNNYYSNVKVPFGFPTKPSAWTIEKKITTNQTSPTYTLTASTSKVYNPFPDLNIIAPIGSYNILYTINMLSDCSNIPAGVKIGFSSANDNQDTFPETNNFWYSATSGYFWGAFFGNTNIDVETSTPLYFLIRPWWSGVTNTQSFRIDGTKVYSFVKLICAYL